MTLRVWNLYYTPIVVSVVYQFVLCARPELKIPVQVTLLAVVACFAAIIVTPAVILAKVLRTNPKEELFTKEKLLASLGPLYNTYQPQLVGLISSRSG
jgi:hypothetical protein